VDWKRKLIVLSTLALPAFIGFPLSAWQAELIAGVRSGWVVYALIVHGIVLMLTGARFYEKVVTIAALIAAPVVFMGATVSYLIHLAGTGGIGAQAAYSAHYVSLSVTMLTVIPLAIGLVALVPFHRFEQQLLTKPGGAAKREKFALMFLRVFNHIAFTVIPTILEIVNEERHYRGWLEVQAREHASLRQRIRIRRRRFAGLLRIMIQIGVEAICAAIQYIPLWAVEISQLPDKSAPGGGRAA